MEHYGGGSLIVLIILVNDEYRTNGINQGGTYYMGLYN